MKKPDRIVHVLPYQGKWRVRYVERGKSYDKWFETDAEARGWAADKTVQFVTSPSSGPSSAERQSASSGAKHGSLLDAALSYAAAEPITLKKWECMLAGLAQYMLANPDDQVARATARGIEGLAKQACVAAKARKILNANEDTVAQLPTEELQGLAALIAEELVRRERCGLLSLEEEA